MSESHQVCQFFHINYENLLYFTELIGAKEFPRDPTPFLSITGDAGCYNDTDLPINPPTASKYHAYS